MMGATANPDMRKAAASPKREYEDNRQPGRFDWEKRTLAGDPCSVGSPGGSFEASEERGKRRDIVRKTALAGASRPC